jgi:hypothetical protein
MDPYVDHTDGDVLAGSVVRTTHSYLTLPCQHLMDTLSESDSAEDPYEYDGYHAETSSFDIVDPTFLQVTDEQKKRFRKGMATLGLEPFIRDCQIFSVDRHHPCPVQASVKPEGYLNDPKRSKLITASRKRLVKMFAVGSG